MPKSTHKPKSKKGWSRKQRRQFDATIAAKRQARTALTNGAPLHTPDAAIELLEAQLAVVRQRAAMLTKALAALRE